MVDPADSSGSESEAILERFLDEIEHARDPDAIVSAYCGQHPQMADDFWLIRFTREIETMADANS
jgi:hypothetical protein